MTNLKAIRLRQGIPKQAFSTKPPHVKRQKRSQRINRYISYPYLLLITCIFWITPFVDCYAHDIEESFVVGRIEKVFSPQVNRELLNATGIISRKQLVEIKILEGPLKNKIVVVPNEITDNPAFNISAVPGHEVVLSVVKDVSTNNGKPEINLADYHRTPVLIVLFCVFLVAFIVLGGKQGFKSLLGLAIAIALIALVLLPMSMRGINPLITAAGICLIVSTTTMLLVAGLSCKAFSAILGTVGGVIVAGLTAHVVIMTAPLTGLSSEAVQVLRGSILTQPPVFFTGLLAASMLIGALGVIMDVGISIASATWEIHQADPSLSQKELYRRGMNVGHDIMGTMTNTLILAYTGGALPLLLLLANLPSEKFLNLDIVATEITSALTGSLGLILTIPLTALAASFLFSYRKQTTAVSKKLAQPETSQTETNNKRLTLNAEDGVR